MTMTLADLATLEALELREFMGSLPPAPPRPSRPPRPNVSRRPVDTGPSYWRYVEREMPSVFSWTVSVWCALVFAALALIFLIGFWHGFVQAWDAGTSAVQTLHAHRTAGMPTPSLLNPGH